VTILARIKNEDERFAEAMKIIFEERAEEFPENTLKRLKELWMEGVHHGHNLRLTEEIIQAVKTGRFDSNSGIFELNVADPNTPTHE
jgi:hypothetical protein